MQEQELDLRGWLEYLKRKNERRSGASIMINASYRLVEMSVLRDRYKMGGKDAIHKINEDGKNN